MRTLVIGRSPFADVVLADASVASHHAELVLTDDGRLYLTDCASASGTWRRAADASAGDPDAWTRVRQAFVDADEPLRLGDHPCTARGLVRAAREPAAMPAAGGEGHGTDAGGEPGGSRLRGRVERDVATGEIVRRRP